MPTSNRGGQGREAGYEIHADWWSKGYATDACRTMVEFGFTGLGLPRISVAIGPDNAVPTAVMRELG